MFSESIKVYLGSGNSKPTTVERVSDTKIRARYTWSGAAIAEKVDAAAAREAEKAAAEALKIKNLTITMAEPVFGQPLPTTASIAESDVEVAVSWSTGDKTGLATTSNTVSLTVTIKEGSDRTFGSAGTKATLNGETRPQNMSNAKLVAEWYNIYDIIDNQKTGFNYNLVRMDRRAELDGELSARAQSYEIIYCYEHDIPTRGHTVKVEEKKTRAQKQP